MTRPGIRALFLLSPSFFLLLCGAASAQDARTVQAVRIASPLRLDGRLDEAPYSTVPPASGFIQMEPRSGEPATQKTDVWVFFDDDNVYVVARCWESNPERMIANEMRHDSNLMAQNEHVVFIFDTFRDKRNGTSFMATPIGGRAEGQVANERQYNGDFNPLWDVGVGRFDGGWTVEAAVPFRSLRYKPGRDQVWGFNISRNNRWKNEISYLTRISNALGLRGLFQVSQAATLVGLEVPAPSLNLEIKPYATADLTTDRVSTPRLNNDPGGDVGIDAKYGVTQNLTADFTYNTDFAQVEADEQQINLTRFSLFFPEKREFFLENRGMFDFGGAGGGTGAGGDTPTIFYSRRIGLQQGRAVPIAGGGRLSGRVGRYTLGLLSIQSGEQAAAGARSTNFSVARVRRDILRRSSIGAIVTRRSLRERGTGSNETYGADGTFAFFDNLGISTYWARTQTGGLGSDDSSFRAQLDYAGDRYGVQAEDLMIGRDFNPEAGFIRRGDMRKRYSQVRFSPRPASMPAIRKFSAIGSITYIENRAGRLETRDWDGEFGIEFQNSDKISVSYNDLYEFLPQPFRVVPQVVLPVGGYDFSAVRGAYTFGQHRKLSGVVSLEDGTFYSGERTTFAVASGRVEFTSRFSLQPTASINWIRLPEGTFTASVAGSRVTYTMTPLMFVSALLQYNSGGRLLASNVRFRWEYRPGSELFVVYNEQRDTTGTGLPTLANRAMIAKITRLVRF